MKLVELKNVSQQRITVTQVRGFRLNPGESMKVTPATAKHPAVAQYIPPRGNGLEMVTADTSEKVEPIAPAPAPAPAPVVEPPVVEEPIAPVEEDEVTQPEEEAEDEVVEDSLREVFIDGPGISEKNVDAVLEMYSSVEELANASKDDLKDLGIAASYVNRLIDWAQEQ